MATIELLQCDIPLEGLQNVEEFTFKTMGMPREAALKRFSEAYEETNEGCLRSITCKGMFKGFSIVSNDGTTIVLEDGATLKSPTLANYLQRADEVVMYAAVENGYEQLVNDPDNGMIEGMFYNAWSAGYSLSAHRWLKALIVQKAHELGRFAGRGWTTGEDKVELQLQQALFEGLNPSAIGITLLDNMLMEPSMSVTGFMGISDDPEMENDFMEVVDHH